MMLKALEYNCIVSIFPRKRFVRVRSDNLAGEHALYDVVPCHPFGAQFRDE